jgi:hypothetical protein
MLPLFLGITRSEGLKSFRHHPDHRVALSIQGDLTAEDIRIGTKAALPESVGQNDNVLAGAVLFRQEGPAQNRLDAQQREETG